MNHDPKLLALWAQDSGFRAEGIEKVVRLGELMHEVSAHAFLAPRLLLKGGTALNLGQDFPPRLSVDLDFNYVGSAKREVMLAERPEVERAVQHLARALGYRPQASAEAHAGRKLYLEYRNVRGLTDRVEIDLNYLFRVPLGEAREVDLWQPGNLPRPRTRAVHLHESAAGKLCALLARSAPRDLFDAARLPGLLGTEWDSVGFRHLFHALAGVLEHPLHRYGREQLLRATPARVEQQLGPMVRQARDLNATELVESAWRAVEPLLRLDEAEYEYTVRMQVGELHPELLFPDDPAMQARLARHPALAWKVANAREHRARQLRR